MCPQEDVQLKIVSKDKCCRSSRVPRDRCAIRTELTSRGKQLMCVVVVVVAGADEGDYRMTGRCLNVRRGSAMIQGPWGYKNN